MRYPKIKQLLSDIDSNVYNLKETVKMLEYNQYLIINNDKKDQNINQLMNTITTLKNIELDLSNILLYLKDDLLNTAEKVAAQYSQRDSEDVDTWAERLSQNLCKIVGET